MVRVVVGVPAFAACFSRGLCRQRANRACGDGRVQRRVTGLQGRGYGEAAAGSHRFSSHVAGERDLKERG